MIDEHKISDQIAQLEELLQTKLGLRGKTLAQRLNKAGRRIPNRIHKAGQTIIKAQSVFGMPKLMLQIDPETVTTAFSTIETYLETLDPKDRRKGTMLSLLGSLSFNLLAIALLLFIVLRWRGYI